MMLSLPGLWLKEEMNLRKKFLLLLLAALCGVSAQAADTPSPTTPLEVQVGSSAVVLAAIDDTVAGYSVVLSSAEKTGRELLIKNERVVSGARSRRLWQWPKDALPEKVFTDVAAQLPGETLFECEGADCGRSNVWSTLVFGEALIYGPSRYQHYRVVRDASGVLHVLYVVRRGNRRVHALYEQIADVTGFASAATIGDRKTNVVAALAATGVARLNVVPGLNGELDAGATKELESIGRSLAGVTAGEIYAVCHLYPGGRSRIIGGNRKERGARAAEVSTEETVENLLAASERCAEAAVTALKAGLATASVAGVAEESKNRQRPALLAFGSFGAGPLLPAAGAFNRIELVVPSRLLRE